MATVAYVASAWVFGSLLIVFNRSVDSAFSQRDGRPASRSPRAVRASRAIYVVVGVVIILLGVHRLRQG